MHGPLNVKFVAHICNPPPPLQFNETQGKQSAILCSVICFCDPFQNETIDWTFLSFIIL